MQKKQKFPWKKNFFRVPEWVKIKIKDQKRPDIIVAAVKKITAADVIAGLYKHLGIHMEGENLIFPSTQIPNVTSGRYSRTNIQGKEVIRRDLPKITKSYTWDSPNFGDWSKGSHQVTIDREVYQREFISPKELEIKIELLDTQQKDGAVIFVLKFTVEEVLSISDEDFEGSLLYNLNLLQENIGRSEVFPSDATREDFMRTVLVEWEILPPGKKEDIIEKIISGFKSVTPEEREKIGLRYDLLSKLKPQCYVRGTSGFHRYFGAMFADDLVVFENIEYGNAIYAMFEDWKKLSKRSRTQLLSGGDTGFERIVHRDGWESKVQELVRNKMIQKEKVA